MNNQQYEAIQPELLAERFAAAERMEDVRLAEQLEKEPRLRELLLLIQWFSFQPGGLSDLGKDVIAAFPDRVLTKAMKKAGPPGRDGQWTLQQALIAWKSEWHGPEPYRRASWAAREAEKRWRLVNNWLPNDDEPETAPALDCGFHEWLAFYFDPDLTAEKVNKGIGCDKANILRGLRQFNHAYFKSLLLETAAERLPAYLRDLCTLPQTSVETGPTWFPDIIAVLLDFMDRHAARVKLSVAETEVSRLIAHVLDDTWETKGVGRITGKSGFGKTEKLKAECRAYPGRWRMIEAPLGDSLPDLIRAVGESLGMAFPYGRLRPEDRQKVEFVLRHMRLGIVIDEAHRLCPEQFNRNSVAERYNWLRYAVLDHDLPCVLNVTFQTDRTETTEERESRFVKTTGFNMEQFTRRITKEGDLPKVLSRNDFLAVARHHCGGLKQAVLNMLVDAAMAAPGGLGVFRRVKLRAARFAERRGSGEVIGQDFADAIAEVPGIPARFDLVANGSPAGAILEKPAKPPRQRRKTPAETVRELRPGRAETDFGVSRMPAGRSEELSSAPVLEAV